MYLKRTRMLCARPALVMALAALIAGCPRPARPPPQPAPSPVPFELEGPLPPDARRFRVVADESLVSILVYRAGTLSKAGHNHVVASHDVSGEVIFAPDVTRSAFALRMPVESLTVDEPGLRGAAGEEFAAEVPDSARQGTRRNMLGEAVFDAGRFPFVELRSVGVARAAGGAEATVQVTVRGQLRTIVVPVRYEQKGRDLLADGEFPLRHTDLGLTPYSALLGALQVQDEMKIRFRIIARAL